ncbi:MAG: SDR family NAD(P)-dependent oxidoreductase, partial [Gammaproteobacteria bacterium]
ARSLHARGWRVFASVRRTSDLGSVEADGLTGILLDLDDPVSVDVAANQVLEATDGHLDALVNNAGFALPGAVEDLGREMLRAQFETNLFGTFDLTARLIPAMRTRGGGRIVMISSILGLVAMPWRGAYNASKFALEGLTDTLRMELHGSGIYVSTVEPGPISSRFRDNAIARFDRHVGETGSVHRDSYRRLRADTGERKDSQPFTLPPEAVARRIVHALEAHRPKSHYLVTTPAWLLAGLRRLLPRAWLDGLLRRI